MMIRNPRNPRFVERLEAKRRELGLSHSEFAVLMGLDMGNWAHIRAGRRGLTMMQVQRAIAKWPELGGTFLAETLRTAV